MNLNHRTYFLRQMPWNFQVGNVSNTDFVQEFGFDETVQYVVQILYPQKTGPRFYERPSSNTGPSLTWLNTNPIGYLHFVLIRIEYKSKHWTPRASWLPIMGVSETLDSKWLIPIFFDNLIMQRIRKGRQSGWRLRKMRTNEKRLNRGWLKAKIEMRD